MTPREHRHFDAAQREFARLRRDLAGVGFVWVGTVLRRFLPCGRKSCRCHRNRRYRHGPYFYWTRKLKGKTVSTLLNPDQGRLYQDWVRNRQRLHKTLGRMYAVSRVAARLILSNPPPGGNP